MVLTGAIEGKTRHIGDGAFLAQEFEKEAFGGKLIINAANKIGKQFGKKDWGSKAKPHVSKASNFIGKNKSASMLGAAAGGAAAYGMLR